MENSEPTQIMENDRKLETYMEPDTQDSSLKITEYDISSAPSDFNVMTIGNFMDSGSVVIPPYQRNYTWDRRRASKLIESLLLGLPIPQIFLYEEARNRFAVLDGQQRLMSLYFFIKGRFPRNERRAELRELFGTKGLYDESILQSDEYFMDFALDLPSLEEGETKPYHKKKYATLEDMKSAFDLRTIRCILIKQNSPDDDQSSVFELFDRLNTGGVNLKPQEIRANLYYSDFYQAIYEINKEPVWRSVFGNELRDTNLRDVELVLRAIAMLVDGKNYKPSMTKFLNNFSARLKKNVEKIDVNYLKEVFLQFCEQILKLNSQGMFRTQDSRFSIGIFEAAFVAYYEKSYEHKVLSPQKAVLLEDLRQIRNNAQPFTLYGSASSENVKKRLEAGKSVLYDG